MYVTWIVGTLVMGGLHGRHRRAVFAVAPHGHQGHELDDRRLAGAMAGRCVSVAISVIGVVVLACTSIFALLVSYGLLAAERATLVPDEFQHGLGTHDELDALLFTILIVLDTSLRFDRIAGRMAGGTVATTVDAMVHGTAHKAVFLPDQKSSRKTKKAAVLPAEEKLQRPLHDELAAVGGESCQPAVRARVALSAHRPAAPGTDGPIVPTRGA